MLKPEHKAAVDKLTLEHNGKKLNPKGMLKPNVMIKKVLAQRLMAMPDDQLQALKGLMTADTAPAIKALLPELGSLIDKQQGAAGGTAG